MNTHIISVRCANKLSFLSLVENGHLKLKFYACQAVFSLSFSSVSFYRIDYFEA